MNDNPPYTTTNHILRSLPDVDRERIAGKLESVELTHGSVLYDADEQISHVYFPNKAMVSVVAYTEEGHAAEVAVIGFEGMTGVEVVLGGERSANQFITQLADGGERMKTADIREEFARGDAMQKLLLQFARKLLTQVSQTALCNRLHTTEKRLSRWLLMCRDRHDSDKLNITQEFLGVMLGTSRTSVSLTANVLQDAGLISYSRGVVTIVDRPGLEEYACSCYRIIRQAYWSDSDGKRRKN
jgi:CRP-like cAMP-binding protein